MWGAIVERQAVETSESVQRPRRDGRASLSFPCTIILPDGKFPCALKDISLGGARIETDCTLEPGRTLWLRFDEYEAFATVMWVRGGECGVKFEDRLPKIIVMKVQGYAVDMDEYQAAQGRRAARSWVIGEESSPPKSPLIKLLDVLGPKSRDKFASCAKCDNGEPCGVHCGYKQYRRHKGAYRLRAIAYLALAALVGAMLGIGSVLIG